MRYSVNGLIIGLVLFTSVEIATAQTGMIGCDPPPPPFENLCLGDNSHTVTTEGVDPNGGVKQTSISVIVDHSAPTVQFEPIAVARRIKQQTIGISVTDTSALSRVVVLINDVVVIDVAPDAPHYAATVKASVRARLAVAATDSAGNTVTNVFVVPR